MVTSWLRGKCFTVWRGVWTIRLLIRSEAGAVTTNTTITLPHVVNVISVPGDTNGTAWIFDVPGAYETYAFSFNSANFSGNPAITWEAMFESTIMHEFLP